MAPAGARRQPRQESALITDETAPHDPPSSIGPFRVLHQLGAGALGPVFRAFDPDRDRLVAIKVFQLDLTPEQATELARTLEAMIRRCEPHPSIAMPVQAGVEGTSAYLVQQYVPFDTLDMHLRRGGTGSVDEALALLRQVADALEAAARVGVRHGALHPRDILVSTTGDVMVTGIGVAGALEAVGASAPVRRPYAAPERVMGRLWDHRADVFTVAVLAFEVLSGRRPAGTGAVAAAQFELEDAGIDVAHWQRTLARGLAESPDDRFSSVGQLIDALEGRVDREPAETSGAAAPAEGVEPFGEATEPGESGEPAWGLGQVEFEADTGPAELEFEADPDQQESAREAGDLEALGPYEPGDVQQRPAEVDSAPSDEEPGGEAPVDDRFRSEVWDAANVARPPEDLPLEVAGRKHEERSLFDLLEATTAGVVPSVEAEPVEWVRPAAASRPPESRALAPSTAPVSPAPEPRSVEPRPPARHDARAPWPAEVSPAEPAQRSWPGLALGMLAGVAVGLALGYALWGRPLPVPAGQPVEPTVTTTAPAQPGPASSEPGQLEPPTAVAEPSAVAPPPPREVSTPPAPRREVPAPSRKLEVARGRLSIRSSPSGARVMLNGQSRGVTPLDLRDVPFGSYELQVARPGYAPDTRRVVLSDRTPVVSLAVSLVAGGVPPAGEPGRAAGAAALDIVSKPPGARVFIDGTLVGLSPLRLPELAAGVHTIRLELEGHRPWTATVSLEAGQAKRVAASLEQDIPR